MAPFFRPRLAMLAVLAALALVVGLPAQAAVADDVELPFEVRFPQEVEKTTFSNTWGARRSGGRPHRGTDLMTEKMTEVYALADGTVSEIGTSARAGRYVMIEHTDGWESYYIHLNNDNLETDDGEAPWHLTIAPGLEEGSEVVAGQLIGWAGDSGNAEWASPHTHLELLHNGGNLNPYHVLADAYEKEKAEIARKAQVLGYQGELLIF